MEELEHKGQFEEAIQLGLHSLKGQASDDFILQMIAMAYLARAQQDQVQTERWAKLGAEYSGKALDANPSDIVNIFNLGQSYEIAGDDLSTSECCRYYQQAAEAFEKLSPLLQGNRATSHGRNIRLAPFRKRNDEELADVKRKLTRCAARRPSEGEPLDRESRTAIEQMSLYTRQGDYDDAVETGLKALKHQPSDATIYQQVAMVYLIRAYKEPELRESLTREAVEYTDKSLGAGPQKKQMQILNLWQAGKSFETAGDLSAHGRCEYYRKALNAFTDQSPLLIGDEITMGSEATPLAAFREENEKDLKRVKEKAASAGCK